MDINDIYNVFNFTGYFESRCNGLCNITSYEVSVDGGMKYYDIDDLPSSIVEF